MESKSEREAPAPTLGEIEGLVVYEAEPGVWLGRLIGMPGVVTQADSADGAMSDLINCRDSIMRLLAERAEMRCDCGAVVRQCEDCAVADYQAAHTECRTCCPLPAERAEGSEPAAWKIEHPPEEGETEWVHRDWTADRRTKELYEYRGYRAIPLYRRAERAEPDGVLREELSLRANTHLLHIQGKGGHDDVVCGDECRTCIRDLAQQQFAEELLASAPQRADLDRDGQ